MPATSHFNLHDKADLDNHYYFDLDHSDTSLQDHVCE